MKIRTFLARVAAVVGLGLLAACASRPASTPSGAPTEPVNGAWALTMLDGQAVKVANERARPTLVFDAAGKRVSGLAAVNRFGGTYFEMGTGLKFGPLLATKMAGAPELNELETKYLRALEETTRWRLVKGELELLAGERVLARFEKVRSGAQAGT